MNYLQIFGYVASGLIAISLMMKNIVKLRWLNLLGASSFATYGFLVGAMPVFFLNSFITLVDIYYLIIIYKKKDDFSLVNANENSPFLKQFVDYYSKDLLHFFPDFDLNKIQHFKVYFVLRNLLPVGLFIYRELGENKIEILVDYAIPNYRDLNNAKFLFKAGRNFFIEHNYQKILATAENPIHKKYLEKIGFRKLSENEFEYYPSL